VLVFLDSDDELLPDALERFGDAIAHGHDVVVAARIAVSPDRREWRTVVPRGRGFLPGGFAVARHRFAEVGGYDPQLRFGENTDLGWRVRGRVESEGREIGLVEAPAVIRYTQASRAYDRAKYDSARRVLERDDAILASDVAGSRAPRKRRATYLAIAGVSAARLGRRREAARLLLRALAHDPLSPARYRNLARVLSPRGATPVPAPEDVGGREARSAIEHEPGAIHGIVVTFDRPGSLAAMVDELAQTGLATLTVVDNAPSPASKDAAMRASATLATTHLPMPENAGPAGGYAAGMAHVLEAAGDDDWILVLDDDRLTGSIETPRQLAAFGAFLANHGAPVGAVGQVGARFDRRLGRLHRLHDDELAGPVSVDYVAGGQMLMLRVAAVRDVGVFDKDLFFAFDDLDYCLRLARHGYGVYAYGPAGLAARRRFGRLGPVGRVTRRGNAWRRYYSVRNHIVVMRRYASFPAAVLVTLAHLFGRAVVDVVKRQPGSVSLLAAGARGCADAWTGRLGRRMEPAPGT
jgi:GT2 family glycosyltransferase